MDKRIIPIDSPEAAKPMITEVWVSASGITFTTESAARYDGCTHRKCQTCGELCEKHYISCESCRDKKDRENFALLPAIEWNEKDPICIYKSDQYFFSPDELEEYCEENEIEKESLMLVGCVPTHPRLLDYDFFEDCLADDQEVPEDLKKAIDEFNAKVAAYPHPLSWQPTNKRIKL